MTAPCKVFFLTILAVFISISFSIDPAYAESNLVISQAWIRHAPPTMKVHAAYLKITNKGKAPRVLVAAESTSYDKAELHISRVVNNVATMEHAAQVEITQGKTIEFRPGGLHIMLINAKKPLELDDQIPLTLIFRNGEKLQVTAQVKKGADNARGSHRGKADDKRGSLGNLKQKDN